MSHLKWSSSPRFSRRPGVSAPNRCLGGHWFDSLRAGSKRNRRVKGAKKGLFSFPNPLFSCHFLFAHPQPESLFTGYVFDSLRIIRTFPCPTLVTNGHFIFIYVVSSQFKAFKTLTCDLKLTLVTHTQVIQFSITKLNC